MRYEYMHTVIYLVQIRRIFDTCIGLQVKQTLSFTT